MITSFWSAETTPVQPAPAGRGTAGDDTLTGTPDADVLRGLDGDDSLEGLDGNDRLDGGAGADTLVGGLGNDRYFVDGEQDVIVELDDEGDDTVIINSDYTLRYSGVERLTVDPSVSTGLLIRVEGVTGFVTGGRGDDTIYAAAAQGGEGDDTYYEDAGFVFEDAGAGTDTLISRDNVSLFSNAEIEFVVISERESNRGFSLLGSDYGNHMSASAGADTLNGGSGADTLVGFEGDDEYWIDDEADLIVEADQGGYDQVYITWDAGRGVEPLSYVLQEGVFVERLRGYGTGDISITGNSLANEIVGDSGENTLIGGGGADTLVGGYGDTTFYVDNEDVVISDVYGRDTVYTSVDFKSKVEIETIMLIGDDDISGYGSYIRNYIKGNAADNYLFGGGYYDTLVGGEGDDTLFGGEGEDVLWGGEGDDTYILNDNKDVIKGETGETGVDTIVSKQGQTFLQSNIENLSLIGTASYGAGNGLDNQIEGNRFYNDLLGRGGDDHLSGGGGGDRLSGGVGADTLVGGKGSDEYLIDSPLDVIEEIAGGGADDVIVSSIDYVLAQKFVENLYAKGGSNVDLTGHGRDNEIRGNSGGNVIEGRGGDDSLFGDKGTDSLYGGAGDDTMSGGEGADSLYGGDGADQFVFEAAWSGRNTDAIMDFEAGDRIDMSDFNLGGFESLKAFLSTTDEGDALVRMDGEFSRYRLVINGVSAGELSEADFIF